MARIDKKALAVAKSYTDSLDSAQASQLAAIVPLLNRFKGEAEAPPSSGTHARGEIYLNSLPDAFGTFGWVCTSGGSYTDFVTPVTVSCVGDSDQFTASSVAELAVGMLIDIEGFDASKTIMHIEGNVITMDTGSYSPIVDVPIHIALPIYGIISISDIYVEGGGGFE